MLNDMITQARLDRLAEAGIIASFCYGPSNGRGVIWSVDAMTTDGQGFDRPFQANSCQHGISIIESEARQRGWINDEVEVITADDLVQLQESLDKQ